MIVFDTSALLAYIRGENGADLVREIIEEADVPLYVHAGNLCEMYHILTRSDGAAFAEQTVRSLALLGVAERGDLDSLFWRDAAALIAGRRIAGTSLPLGDALGVALARRLDAEFVTADHPEIEPLEAAGLVKVLFIR